MLYKLFLPTRIFFLCSLILIASFDAKRVQADSLGVSYYAMQGFDLYKCYQALRVFDDVKEPAIAVLWGTFGEDNRCIKAFLDSFIDRAHTLEIHITNQTCLRDNSCQEGELFSKIGTRDYSRMIEKRNPLMMRKLRARIREIVNFVAENRNKNTRVILSTGLEDDYSWRAYPIVLEVLNEFQEVTNFETVRSPHLRHQAAVGTIGAADLIELHGFKPDLIEDLHGRCVINNDGEDIFFTSTSPLTGKQFEETPRFFKRHLDRACTVFFWWTLPQGLQRGEGSPRRRQFIVRSNEVSQINQLIKSLEE